MKLEQHPIEEEKIPEPDYDTRWKEVIEKFAPEFVQFHYPRSLWRDIDHSRGIKPMTDELQKMFPDFEKKGRLYPDKLIKMFLKTGEEHFVIVHTEVERNPSKDIGKRIYQYFVRLQERNPNAIITSLVVFIDKYIPKKCDVYTYKKYGTKFTFRYKVCKIKELDEKKLLKSKNPIALVILAAYYNIKTEGRKNLNQRLQFKLRLAKLCFERGFDKKYILDLLWFVSYSIALPKRSEQVYQNEVTSLVKKEIMPLSDEYPRATTQVIEVLLYGKTLEERDAKRDAKIAAKAKAEIHKSNILRMLRFDMEVPQIAKILDLDIKFVQEIIQNVN